MKKLISIVVVVLFTAVLVIPALAESPPGQPILTLPGAVCDSASCHLPIDWTGVVPPDVTISGDIKVNDVAKYDTLAGTGLVIYTGPVTDTQPSIIFAKWGADLKVGNWLEVKANDLLDNGCTDTDNDGIGNGCDRVWAEDLTTFGNWVYPPKR